MTPAPDGATFSAVADGGIMAFESKTFKIRNDLGYGSWGLYDGITGDYETMVNNKDLRIFFGEEILNELVRKAKQSEDDTAEFKIHIFA